MSFNFDGMSQTEVANVRLFLTQLIMSKEQELENEKSVTSK